MQSGTRLAAGSWALTTVATADPQQARNARRISTAARSMRSGPVPSGHLHPAQQSKLPRFRNAIPALTHPFPRPSRASAGTSSMAPRAAWRWPKPLNRTHARTWSSRAMRASSTSCAPSSRSSSADRGTIHVLPDWEVLPYDLFSPHPGHHFRTPRGARRTAAPEVRRCCWPRPTRWVSVSLRAAMSMAARSTSRWATNCRSNRCARGWWSPAMPRCRRSARPANSHCAVRCSTCSRWARRRRCASTCSTTRSRSFASSIRIRSAPAIR